MADKTVNELPRAATVTTADLFVLEQGGQAKSLTGQVLINDLATALDGHGGINSITLNDDYTLTFTLADETTVTTTSVRGATGAKGDKGADGRSITNVSKTGTAGLVDTYKVTLTNNATSTFTVTNGNGIASVELQSGTHAAGTSDVYKITFDNGQYTTFSVYNGMNGTGATSTVNNKSPDKNGNVTLTASDVGAASVGDLQIINERLETKIDQKQDTTASLTAGSQNDINNLTYFPSLTLKGGNKKIKWEDMFSKILASIFGQSLATPTGILKGGGNTGSWITSVDSIATDDITDGAVTRSKLAQDAFYSPIITLNNNSDSRTYALTTSDIGKTIYNTGLDYTFSLGEAASDAMPIGAEIAILHSSFGSKETIIFDGVYAAIKNEATTKLNVTVEISEPFTLIALKKIGNKVWLISGDVEVVT